jgi:hypothetical protein
MFDATDALVLQYVIISMAIILWLLTRVRKKAGLLLSMKIPIELNKVCSRLSAFSRGHSAKIYISLLKHFNTLCLVPVALSLK